jgi:hypothetical protein
MSYPVPSSDRSHASGRPRDQWYVTNGKVAVGPITYELLLRGIRHGKIPADSFIRHESWNVWRRLDELEQLNEDGLDQTVRELADISAKLEDRASSPYSVPPPPPSQEQLDSEWEPASYRSSRPARSSFRPPAVDPVGVLGQAYDLNEALLLTLSTSVTAAAAEVGLLHRRRPDLGGVITTFGHGPNTERLLGERLTEADPTVLAAELGVTVMAEPQRGEIGRHIAGRIGRCVPAVRGLAMVPLSVHGALELVIELGKIGEPFRAREIARVEDVVATLGERAIVMGWFEG